MNLRIFFIIAIVVIPLCAGAILPVMAEDKDQGFRDAPLNGAGFIKTLQNLTARGYDVSTIQAAVNIGDNQTARKLLNTFYETYPETKPEMPVMSADRIKGIISNLSQKGNDVSQIQKSLDAGDIKAAQNLLDTFYKEHPDQRQTPPTRGEKPSQ